MAKFWFPCIAAMAKAQTRRAIPRRRRRNRRVPDSRILSGIKQGVGRSVVRAFDNSGGGRRRRRGMGTGFNPCYLDAFHFAHLTLPRPTGPYTIIRTTELVDCKDSLIVFGPVRTADQWSNILAFSYADWTKSASQPNNINQWVFQSIKAQAWNAAQVVPAAFSVQIMNPEAIQSSSGIVYSSRIRTAWKIQDNESVAGKEINNRFISYNNPRLMSAAKLAFRGVQVDSVPFNMSEMADFRTFHPVSNTTTTVTGKDFVDFSAMSPIFVSNPKNIELQFLVCCEWRVRFDPSNPAQAAHVQHIHSNENVWMQALHFAENVGNGVVDIADKVANVGNSMFRASAGTYRAARGMRALTQGLGTLALA